jgi:ubiquinone/menaquinone biosynthesis C-methylase UbiE
MGAQSADYILGHPESEMETLGVLSRAYHPFTRQVFACAGLKEGMKVLEIGSGGDVAMLAAEFVGRSGRVVGVEQSHEAIEHAIHHAAARALDNVKFVTAQLDQGLPFEREFDALVGRIVLMFLPSPAETLTQLLRHVVPGGLVIFQEPDMSWAKSTPATPMVEKAAAWMREIFQRSGAHSEFGPRLYSVFKEAGLPDPEMRVDGLIYGSDGAGPALLAESIRAILPAIEQFGLESAEEVDIDTFEDRMRAELDAANATMSAPLLVSAWARVSD